MLESELASSEAQQKKDKEEFGKLRADSQKERKEFERLRSNYQKEMVLIESTLNEERSKR